MPTTLPCPICGGRFRSIARFRPHVWYDHVEDQEEEEKTAVTSSPSNTFSPSATSVTAATSKTTPTSITCHLSENVLVTPPTLAAHSTSPKEEEIENALTFNQEEFMPRIISALSPMNVLFVENGLERKGLLEITR